MQIIINGTVNKVDKGTNIPEKIIELVGDHLIYSHMIVDGVEVYEDPAQCFENLKFNGTEVETLEVIALTADEYIKDLSVEGYQYISRAIPILQEGIQQIYRDGIGSNLSLFLDLFESSQWIIHSLHTIQQISEIKTNLLLDRFENVLKELNLALENADQILTADILEYEMVEVLEEIKQLYYKIEMNEVII